MDAPAAAAWKEKLAQLEAAMDGAIDLPAQVRESYEYGKFNRTISPVVSAMQAGAAADWNVVTQAVLAFAAKYPTNQALGPNLRNVMYAYEGSHRPEESAAAWRPLTAAANAAIAEMARDKVRAFEAISGPQELAFTAIDGREVDLQKLRGKVVLLDFWATWCGPCMAEMPNVKKVYAAYHDKGLEIVGISCDYAPDQSGHYPAASARTGPQVLEFVKKNDMPWPEYYDGRKHNEGGNLLAKRFAVTGIPASFLLDQAGHVVALNLRGEKLESEVKRLLKL